jgi:hypothetical protein
MDKRGTYTQMKEIWVVPHFAFVTGYRLKHGSKVSFLILAVESYHLSLMLNAHCNRIAKLGA